MATDLEKLVVSLEASIKGYERSMNKALGVSNQRAKQIEQRWAKLNISPKTLFRDFTRGALSALAPALTLAAAIHGTKTALKEYGDVADNSRAAGVDAEFFQGIAYQAGLGGVAINETASALATFAKNSGLAAEGKGKMVTALKALDPVLLENIRKATTQEERIRLAADALEKQTDAGKRAALGAALFGDAGIKLAGELAKGADELDSMQVKARELGLVVDRELIERADELGDEFDTTTKIVDLQLKQALIDLGPVLVWLAGLAGGIAEQVGGAVDALKPLAEQRRSTIEGSLSGITSRQNDVNPAMSAGLSAEDADALRKPLLEELRRRAVDELRRQLTAVQPPAGAGVPTLEEIEDRNKAAEAAIKQAEATKAYIENLRFENQLIGLTALEQAKLSAVRQSGAAAASAEADEVARLTDEGFKHREQLEATTTLYGELGDIGQAAVEGIVDAMRDGKIEASELTDILSNLLGMAGNFFLSQAFGSFGNGGSSVLQTLFGGKREGGGPVQAGKAYVVGEKRPELFVPRTDGMILPRVPGGQGGLTVHAPVTINGNVDAMTMRDLRNWARFELPATIRHHARTSMPENG